jgi:hypothetical protein
MVGAYLVILPSHVLVLLDTSVLVHLARQDPTGVWIEDQFALSARADRPLISTITKVRSLAFRANAIGVHLVWLNSPDCSVKSSESTQGSPRSSTPTRT